MNKWIKGFIGVASVLLLAACGGEENGDTAASKIDQIKEKGVLTIATSADYPPYEWHLVKDGKDTIVGFDIDIAQGIADELGVDLKVSDMDFNGLIPALTNGKVDLVIAGMNPTPERAEEVDFTDIYVSTQDVVLIRKEDQDKLNTQEAMAEANWATQKSTIQEEYLLENYDQNQIQSVGKWGAAIVSLKSGKVDGILMVETVASQYAKENDDLMIADFEIASEPNEAAIAVQKGNDEFLEEVNGILSEMKESGKVDELILKNTQLMEDNTEE